MASRTLPPSMWREPAGVWRLRLMAGRAHSVLQAQYVRRFLILWTEQNASIPCACPLACAGPTGGDRNEVIL